MFELIMIYVAITIFVFFMTRQSQFASAFSELDHFCMCTLWPFAVMIIVGVCVFILFHYFYFGKDDDFREFE